MLGVNCTELETVCHKKNFAKLEYAKLIIQQITGLCNPGRETPQINSYVDKFEQDDEDIIVFNKVAL